MFYGQLKENGDIQMTDVSEAAFQVFLQFFHLNKVEIGIEHIAELIHLEHKYMVTNCIDVCNQFLKVCHTADNTLFVLNLSMLYGQFDLFRGWIVWCLHGMGVNTKWTQRSIKGDRRCTVPYCGWPIHVKITESCGRYGAHKVLLEIIEQTSFESSTIISLLRPILIMPVFFYRIFIKISDDYESNSKHKNCILTMKKKPKK